MPNSFNEPHFVSQVDIVHSATQQEPLSNRLSGQIQEPLSELCFLMRELLAAQDRQNELLEELITQTGQNQRRKTVELALWKRSNPELSEFCRKAAVKLERVQTDLLSTITEEIDTNSDSLLESEYCLNEFVDRFGMKFVQLNTLVQVLTQLGNAPEIRVQRHNESGVAKRTVMRNEK
ncbi:MAG: hypothetical protein LBT09_04575 [Planctomycetaceae bacterium]|jgi:hypothetical protein|nr:hypothetical protein [Planctomycetaceae bacterium]